MHAGVQGVSLYQGDILLTREQQSTLEDTSNPDDPYGPQRAVVRRTRSVWLDGRVPYVIDSLGKSRTARAAEHPSTVQWNARVVSACFVCLSLCRRDSRRSHTRSYCRVY